MATNTNPFYTYSATAGSSKTLQKPQDGGDNNQWGNYINTDLDEIVAAVNALSDKIADANEKTLVDFTATTDAVNHVGITNAATGNPPQISSAGSDTNVDLTLTAKGTGDINLTPGTNGDVNIPASKGITFGDDGEKIEGDGTDLTIASSATLNVNTGSSSGNDLKVNTSQLVVEGDTGNVGIGISNPSQLLSLQSATTSKISMENTGDAGVVLTMDADRSGANAGLGSIQFKWNGTAVGQVSGASGSDTSNKDDGDLTFSTTTSGGSLTERMRVKSGGDVEVKTGNLVIGTAGQGIDFSINGGNAETLDEYEEGTFTLSVVNYSGGTAPIINSQNTTPYFNRYVKIGKTIICSIYISFDFNSNAEIVFSGLPEIADGGGPVTLTHDSSMSKIQLGFGSVLHGTDDFSYFRDSVATATSSSRIYNIGLTYVTT
jgi:hypothetical protein